MVILVQNLEVPLTFNYQWLVFQFYWMPFFVISPICSHISIIARTKKQKNTCSYLVFYIEINCFFPNFCHPSCWATFEIAADNIFAVFSALFFVSLRYIVDIVSVPEIRKPIFAGWRSFSPYWLLREHLLITQICHFSPTFNCSYICPFFLGVIPDPVRDLTRYCSKAKYRHWLT